MSRRRWFKCRCRLLKCRRRRFRCRFPRSGGRGRWFGSRRRWFRCRRRWFRCRDHCFHHRRRDLNKRRRYFEHRRRYFNKRRRYFEHRRRYFNKRRRYCKHRRRYCRHRRRHFNYRRRCCSTDAAPKCVGEPVRNPGRGVQSIDAGIPNPGVEVPGMESVPEQPATRSATPARVFKASSMGFRTPAPLLFGSAPAPQEFKPTHSGAASGFKVPASRLREGFWRLRNALRAGRDRAAAGSGGGRGGCGRLCGLVTMRLGSGRMPGVCACSRSTLRVGPEPGVGAAAGQARGLAPTGMGIAWGHGLALASVCPMSRRPRTRRFPAMPP